MLVILSLLLVSIILFLYFDIRKPRNFPPGPKWLPIVGSALEVQRIREKTGYLYKAANVLLDKYCNRGVLGLRVGKDRIVIVCAVEAVREMLLNEDIDGRPKGLFYETRTWGKRRGIVLTDGILWKEQRRFIIKHLKDFGFGRRRMNETVRAEAEHLYLDMKSKVDSQNNAAIVQLHDAFNTYVLNTLWSMMANVRYSAHDSQLKELQELLFDLFANVDMVGALFSQFPFLKYLAPGYSGYNSFVYIHTRILTFLETELKKHLERFDPDNEDQDFMDAYIRMMNSPSTTPTFSLQQLLAICMDLFMAGTETTSKTLGFAFSYLVRNPKVQRKAQEEIDAVVGRDRLPTLDDKQKMPYNEAIVFESVRHFMGRTFGIPHRAMKTTKLRGYTIPKDTMVVPSFNCILINEDLYEDANSFKPERFIVDGKLSVPEYYVAFGMGKHRCIGEVLARSNVFLFTTTLLQNFNFVVPEGHPEPSLIHIDGATPSAAPFQALVTHRQK